MMEKIQGLRKQLSELASVLNEFKSEAVQLRILDFVLEEAATSGDDEQNDLSPSRKKNKGQARPRAIKGPPSGGKRKRGPAGTGAPATLGQLAAGNFFDRPRTIHDIIEHCKHNLARTFKANEFSGKLGRMVRKGELNRKKNADKQYEYKKP